MICKNKRCHKEIDDDSVYCKYCGRKQTKDEKNPSAIQTDMVA